MDTYACFRVYDVCICTSVCTFLCVKSMYMSQSICGDQKATSHPSKQSVCCYTHQLNWPESSRSSVPRAGMCICHAIRVLTSQWRVTQTVAHMSVVHSCLLRSGDPWSQGVTICSPVVPQRMPGHICSPATANGSTVCAVCTSLCE